MRPEQRWQLREDAAAMELAEGMFWARTTGPWHEVKNPRALPYWWACRARYEATRRRVDGA